MANPISRDFIARPDFDALLASNTNKYFLRVANTLTPSLRVTLAAATRGPVTGTLAVSVTPQ